MMPTPEEISSEKQRLYESASLRDDLNDNEATILLEWGESQVDRLAVDFPDEFEAKARFLRQLLKNVNRFVGQREFNDQAGQEKYMKKVGMYLEPLGWTDLSTGDLFEVLPDDKANMFANLMAIIRILSAKEDSEADMVSDEPPSNDASPSVIALEDNAEKIIEDIIDPIFSAEAYHSIGARDINDKNEAVSDNTEAEDDTSEPNAFGKFLGGIFNHGEEE